MNGDWLVAVASIERTLRCCIVESERSPNNRHAWKEMKKVSLQGFTGEERKSILEKNMRRPQGLNNHHKEGEKDLNPIRTEIN